MPKITTCTADFQQHLRKVVRDIIETNRKKKLTFSSFKGGFCIYKTIVEARICQHLISHVKTCDNWRNPIKSDKNNYYCATGTYKKRVAISGEASSWGLEDGFEERQFVSKEPCHPAFKVKYEILGGLLMSFRDLGRNGVRLVYVV